MGCCLPTLHYGEIPPEPEDGESPRQSSTMIPRATAPSSSAGGGAGGGVVSQSIDGDGVRSLSTGTIDENRQILKAQIEKSEYEKFYYDAERQRIEFEMQAFRLKAQRDSNQESTGARESTQRDSIQESADAGESSFGRQGELDRVAQKLVKW